MNTLPITKRQSEVLNFLGRYNEKHGYMPTLQEMSEDIGIGRSTVRAHLRELEKRGRIVIKNRQRRGIVLIAQK